MIAPSRMDAVEPEVRFPVAWPLATATNAREILARLQFGVEVFWPHIAPVVEIARTNGGGGLLRVALEATAATVTRGGDGGQWFMANATAVWMRTPPPAELVRKLSPGEREEARNGPTETEVSVFLAVLTDRVSTRVARVCAADPHAKWLAAELERGTDYERTPCVVVALSDTEATA